jgi:hypothetical protein
MADLTTLEEKLAEVTGLAAAAQETTEKSSRYSRTTPAPWPRPCAGCARRREETESRCGDLAAERDGKKTAILEKAQETKSEATEMMRTYLGDDADDLDGFEFLIMAEAGEAGHWAILGKLNESAGEDGVRELVEWALPIQERHLSSVREGSLELAADEDPNA